MQYNVSRLPKSYFEKHLFGILPTKKKIEKEGGMVMESHNNVNDEQYANRVLTQSGYVIWDDEEPVGLMHHVILWDNLPFLNLIFMREECRGKGFGTEAMCLWEEDMRNRGYKMVLI